MIISDTIFERLINLIDYSYSNTTVYANFENKFYLLDASYSDKHDIVELALWSGKDKSKQINLTESQETCVFQILEKKYLKKYMS